ncbi:MAG: hypothetical protein WCV70_03675 [Patescibacteria group bacterium]
MKKSNPIYWFIVVVVWLGLLFLAVASGALWLFVKLPKLIKEKIAERYIGTPNLPVGRCRS